MLFLVTRWWEALIWVKSYSLKVLSSFLPTVSSKSLLQGLVSVSRLMLQHSLSDAEGKDRRKNSSLPNTQVSRRGILVDVTQQVAVQNQSQGHGGHNREGCPGSWGLSLVSKGLFSATKGTKRSGERIQLSKRYLAGEQ